ncbi:MAG: 16S rRNA (adenine(1518)-N(6)/adenine(1519)-N(6))-dimethyltransferase RsmA [Verrucomicrobiota bacterium]|nr:16S rRNA (adenine(1518)-N(6)/adenine(1519)-N(6))-dimethyltransferase RsmA [Verrucomicrobiota bacterium]
MTSPSGPGSILSPSATTHLLRQLGIFPSRKLGQNFLIDGNIVRRSLEMAAIAPGDVVVEVGPGLGTLTSGLLQAGATVYAVELDSRLAAYLRGDFRASLQPETSARFHLMEADAVDSPIAGLPADVEKFKVVANLPYAISTPWFDAIVSGKLPQSLVLMLQKEAAQRLQSAPGSKDFSAFSIFLSGVYESFGNHHVSNHCFHPVPEVASILLGLKLKAAPILYPKEIKLLIRQIFTQRRKQLGGLCRKEPRLATWLEQAAAHGVTPLSRAEDVPLAAWEMLAK